MMSQMEMFFSSFLGLFHDCMVYFSIQLGRCVLLSFILLLLVLFLRGIVFRKTVFLRGMVWCVLLISPFLGKLRLFYENEVMCKLFMWWNNICIEYPQISYAYLFGIIICAGLIFWKYKKLHRIVSKMEKDRICGQEVYVNHMPVTPFTTGLIHVKIAIPKMMLENFKIEELQTVLLHERVHIWLGHLWCYLLWDILCVLLWLNPFLMICRRFLKEDMEDICDRVTIQKGNRTAYEYGILLLKCIKLLRLENEELPVAFVEKKDYRNIKQRFVKIVEFIPYKKSEVFILSMCGVAVLLGMFFMVRQISYPCYTEKNDIVLMSDAGEMWMLYDNEKLRNAFYSDGKNVFINKQKMEIVLQEYGITEKTFYLGFGGYIKMPGIGGGMNLVYIDLDGHNEKVVVPYWDRGKYITTIIFKKI